MSYVFRTVALPKKASAGSVLGLAIEHHIWYHASSSKAFEISSDPDLPEPGAKKALVPE